MWLKKVVKWMSLQPIDSRVIIPKTFEAGKIRHRQQSGVLEQEQQLTAEISQQEMRKQKQVQQGSKGYEVNDYNKEHEERKKQQQGKKNKQRKTNKKSEKKVVRNNYHIDITL